MKAVLAEPFMLLGIICLLAMVAWEIVKIIRGRPRKPHDE